MGEREAWGGAVREGRGLKLEKGLELVEESGNGRVAEIRGEEGVVEGEGEEGRGERWRGRKMEVVEGRGEGREM